MKFKKNSWNVREASIHKQKYLGKGSATQKRSQVVLYLVNYSDSLELFV